MSLFAGGVESLIPMGSVFVRLVALSGHRWPAIAGACGLASLSTGATLIAFVVICHVFSTYVAGSHDPVWGWAGLACLLLLSQPIFAGLATKIAHEATFHVLADIRCSLLQKLGRLPPSCLQAHSTGELRKVVSDDVEVLEAFLSHQLPDMAAAYTAPLIALAFLTFIDWRLGLAASVTIPCVGVACFFMMRRHTDKIGQYFQLLRHISRSAMDYIQGVTILRSSGGGQDSFRRLQNHIMAFKNFATAWQKQWLVPWTLFSVLAGASLLGVIPVGYVLFLKGDLAVSSFWLAFFICLGIGPPLIKMLLYTEIFLRDSKAEAAITRLLNSPEIDVHPRAATTCPVPSLHFSNVTVQHDGVTVLDKITLTLPPRTTTGLVGLSGAGKTSLIRLLTRHLIATSGCVKIGHVPVEHYDPNALSSLVAVISQKTFLFQDTIASNLRAGRPSATDADLEEAAQAANILDCIKALPYGFDTVIGENGATLSAGERQRLSLARALLCHAPILILDEATAHVDPIHEALIQKALNPFAGEKTILIVAHRLDSIHRCDHIALLSQGRLEAFGQHAVLLHTSPSYARLWDMQTENLAWSLGTSMGGPAPCLDAPRHHM